MHQEIPRELDDLAKLVVDAAFNLHKALGPGLLQSADQACLEIELEKRRVPFVPQRILPICDERVTVEGACRVDLLVGNQLVVGLKAVDRLLPIYSAQLLTYLRLSGNRLGLLINFNTPLIEDGTKRIAL